MEGTSNLIYWERQDPSKTGREEVCLLAPGASLKFREGMEEENVSKKVD